MMQRKKSNRVGSKFSVGSNVGKKALTQLIRASGTRQYQRSGTGVNSSSVFQAPRGKELKYLDTSSTQSPAVAGTGTLSAGLCLTAQGTDVINRIGNELTVKSMQWRQSVSLNTTTGGGSVRTVVVYDKAPGGASPTIFSNAKTDIFNADNINAQMSLGNRDRFVILADILTPCVGTAGPQADYQKGFRKVSLPQVYTGASANVSTLNVGNIIAVTWASPGFATAAPTVTLETRFRYEDA